jgi:Bestrophin, RFP-TM, chloride channel
MLSELVEASGVTGWQRNQMHDNLTVFHDVLGDCERLLQTPIPLPYTRLTTRFLVIWLAALPVLTAAHLGAALIPVTFFTSLLLLGAPRSRRWPGSAWVPPRAIVVRHAPCCRGWATPYIMNE